LCTVAGVMHGGALRKFAVLRTIVEGPEAIGDLRIHDRQPRHRAGLGRNRRGAAVERERVNTKIRRSERMRMDPSR
jgi:hypothetical protein